MKRRASLFFAYNACENGRQRKVYNVHREGKKERRGRGSGDNIILYMHIIMCQKHRPECTHLSGYLKTNTWGRHVATYV
jgi:hypothetical protein